MDPEEPTPHWCRKMKTIFRTMDVDRKGYVTKEMLMERLDKLLEIYPDIDIESLRQDMIRSWIDHANCGVEMPEGYRLTESQFVQNVWQTIRKPAFKQVLQDLSRKFMQQMDVQKKGHITKTEFIDLYAKMIEPMSRCTEQYEHASAAFDAMDKKGGGKITHEEVTEAWQFFYTDTDSVDHPLNHMQGLLAD